jgi:hypothetical protein
MAAAEPLPRTYQPIVTGYKRTAGGNIEVTWSVAPGQSLRRTVPVEAFNEGTIAELTREIAGRS